MVAIPVSRLGPLAQEAKISRATLSDKVEAVLREAILTGVLKQGAELNQVQLAEQFGVSRVPVREALLRLESEGLVVSLPYRSTVVAKLDTTVLVEIFDIRRLLELRALELAMGVLPDETIDELERLLDEQNDEPDHKSWLATNRKFHGTIYRASGRDVLCQLIDQMQARTARYLSHYSKSLVRHAEADREHREILAAMRARDVALAQSRLAAHLESTLQALLGLVHENGAGDGELE